MNTTIIIEGGSVKVVSDGSQVVCRNDVIGGTEIRITSQDPAAKLDLKELRAAGHSPAQILTAAPLVKTTHHHGHVGVIDAPKKPVASVEKICVGCSRPFTASGTGMHKRKRCDDCKAAGTKPKASSGREIVAPAPKPASAPETAKETKPAAIAPQFLPGHEKSPEEIEKWRPKPAAAATSERYDDINHKPADADWWCVHCKRWTTHRSPDCPAVDHEHAAALQREADEAFTDPWDCQLCRTLGHLCELHHSLHKDGKTPPKM